MKKILAVAAITLSVAGGAWAFDPVQMVEQTKNGEFIVRNIQKVAGDRFVKSCVQNSPEWRKADSIERHKLLNLGRDIVSRLDKKVYELVSVMRAVMFTSSYFYALVPRGTVKIGDQVIAKLTTHKKIHENIPVCPSLKSTQPLAIARVVKHHSGPLLYSRGKFIETIGDDGQPEKNFVAQKGQSKSPSFLD